MDKSQEKWIIAHLGARDQYIAARAMHKIGQLEALYTDFWVKPCLEQVCDKLQVKKWFHGRFHADLRDAEVTAFNTASLLDRLSEKYRKYSMFEKWMLRGSNFGNRVVIKLKAINDNIKYGFIGFSCGSLEILDYCRNCNIKSIYMQIDPGTDYYTTKQNEWKLYQDLEPMPVMPSVEFCKRINSEWNLSDMVLVNSKYSKQCVLNQGLSEEKVAVIPLSYERQSLGRRSEVEKEVNAIKVLFVGTISLVKGFHYYAKVARMLAGKHIQFYAVGNSTMDKKYLKECGEHVIFKGYLNRYHLQSLYQEAHILVFPTLSDGFGLVQLEAMSNGLAVIATPCCGEVVEDCVDGYVVNPRSSEEIAERIDYLVSHVEIMKEMSKNALAKSYQFGAEAYGMHLSRYLAGMRC